MKLPRWPYSHGPGGTDTIHGLVVRIEIQPFEVARAEYSPGISWKRGPIPKSCAECHDSAGYHKPECSRPEPEYEMVKRGVLPLVCGAVELMSTGEFHPGHGLEFVRQMVEKKVEELLLGYQEKILAKDKSGAP